MPRASRLTVVAAIGGALVAFAAVPAGLVYLIAAPVSQALAEAPAEDEARPARPEPAPVIVQHAPDPQDARFDCEHDIWVGIHRMSVDAIEGLVDMGAREHATGTVGRDDEGRIVSYTVASDDVPAAIGERLCIVNGGLLGMMNHVRTIQPGQVLWLDPDPDAPWVPYYQPPEAVAGQPQIPYQQAIEEMGQAADAADVDAMRRIWDDRLSAMFANPDDRAVVDRELEAGDLDVLRQMFS